MPPDLLVSLAGIIFLGVGVGYWYGRSGDSNRGLHWRFREYAEDLPKRSEKAVSAYLREAEKDRSEPGAAFELAAYFRSGGDWRRALQIHESLASREDLDAATRAHAGLEIGDDYRAAGMLDRAEEAYARTAEFLPLRLNALERQLGVCEQLAAWDRAVNVAEQVRREDPELGSRLSCHYLCELAALAVREGDLRQARGCWRKAARRDGHTARLLVDRAVLDAANPGRSLTVAGHNPGEAVLILLGLSKTLDVTWERGLPALEDELNQLLQRQVAETPAIRRPLACTVLIAPELLCATSAECLFEALQETLPAYARMYASGRPADFTRSALSRLSEDLQTATGDPPGWRCTLCGSLHEAHNWRCAECGAWEAARLISPFSP